MSGSGAQRLADVSRRRTVVYGVLVVGAAYLVAATYGPDGPYARLGLAAVGAIVYVAVVHGVGLLRHRAVN